MIIAIPDDKIDRVKDVTDVQVLSGDEEALPLRYKQRTLPTEFGEFVATFWAEENRYMIVHDGDTPNEPVTEMRIAGSAESLDEENGHGGQSPACWTVNGIPVVFSMDFNRSKGVDDLGERTRTLTSTVTRHNGRYNSGTESQHTKIRAAIAKAIDAHFDANPNFHELVLTNQRERDTLNQTNAIRKAANDLADLLEEAKLA